MIEFIWRSDGNIIDELSKFLYSVWLLRVLCFGYYYHKTSTAVYPVPRYFFTVNTVDEILSTAHPYYLASVFIPTLFHHWILGTTPFTPAGSGRCHPRPEIPEARTGRPCLPVAHPEPTGCGGRAAKYRRFDPSKTTLILHYTWWWSWDIFYMWTTPKSTKLSLVRNEYNSATRP